jgi:hypothetical protein
VSLSEDINAGTISVFPPAITEFAPEVIAQPPVASAESIETKTVRTDTKCPIPSFDDLKFGIKSEAILRTGLRINISINTISDPVQTRPLLP